MKSVFAALALVLCLNFSYAQEKKEEKKVEEKKEEKKFDAAKLVGKWEVTKGMPKGAIIEMMKDGKMSFTMNANGKEIKIDGTYELKGDKLNLTMSIPEVKDPIKETLTVKSLNDEKLVTLDKDGSEDELTKKK